MARHHFLGILALVVVLAALGACAPESVDVLGDQRAEGARLFVDGVEVGRLKLSQNMMSVPRPPGGDSGNLIGYYSVDGRDLRMKRGRHAVLAVRDSGDTLKTEIDPGGESNAVYLDFTADTAWVMVIRY